MKCPTCHVTLNRVNYENYPAFQCSECSGYLLEKQQMSSIKSSRDRSSAVLQQEVAEQRDSDTQVQIRCPKCLARMMTKEEIPMKEAGGEPFFIDVCRTCHLVWFNGGELARLQLDYENSAKAFEELEFRLRAEQRTPEEKEQFEKRVAELPPAGFSLSEALMRVVGGVILSVSGVVLLTYHYWTSSVNIWFFVDIKFLGAIVLLMLGVRLILR